MKKVAILYSGKSNTLNGLALFVDRFNKYRKEYKKRGYDIVVFDLNDSRNAYRDDESYRKAQMEDAVAYARSGVHKFKDRCKDCLSQTAFGSRLSVYLSNERYAKKIMKRDYEEIADCDILLSNDVFIVDLALKKFADKKQIFVMHNDGNLYSMLLAKYPKLQNIGYARRLRDIEEAILTKTDALSFVSENAMNAFKRMHAEASEKCHFIAGAIEDDQDVRKSKDFNKIKLVTVGSICDRKNQFAVIKALQRFDSKDIELTIVGSGDRFDECREYIEDHSIGNVTMTGFVESTIPYMNEGNVFVSASLDEGLPAVGVEALRSAMVMIVTDVGGCSELIEDNGFLIKPGSDEELYFALQKVIEERDRLKFMSKNSRKLYDNKYSMGRMIDRYSELFGSLERV